MANAQEESVTITTYYPSPYGSYNELSTYSDTHLAIQSGNVGIGTTNPGAKLEVAGPVKITDGSQGDNKVLTSDAAGLASWRMTATGQGAHYGLIKIQENNAGSFYCPGSGILPACYPFVCSAIPPGQCNSGSTFISGRFCTTYSPSCPVGYSLTMINDQTEICGLDAWSVTKVYTCIKQ